MAKLLAVDLVPLIDVEAHLRWRWRESPQLFDRGPATTVNRNPAKAREIADRLRAIPVKVSRLRPDCVDTIAALLALKADEIGDDEASLRDCLSAIEPFQRAAFIHPSLVSTMSDDWFDRKAYAAPTLYRDFFVRA